MSQPGPSSFKGRETSRLICSGAKNDRRRSNIEWEGVCRDALRGFTVKDIRYQVVQAII